MPPHLYLAPAAAGKTAWAIDLVREAARGLASTPRVVVSTLLQARSWRRRLAESGGALGVRVLTFDRLYAACLDVAGEAYTGLTDPVQYRLLRAVVDGLALQHYAPLAARPGFVEVLRDLVAALKAARVHPDHFSRAIDALGGEPRLAELARLYAAYQERLQAQRWADRAGLGWLAVEALEQRAPAAARDWPLLVVDGFDSFSAVQLALLKVLSGRVGTLVVTLTGAPGPSRPFVHRRFDRTRAQVEDALGVRAQPLPVAGSAHAPALAHLEAALFRPEAAPVDSGGAVDLLEAPDRAGEVREALRWLKARAVDDGMRLSDLALLARHTEPYRPFLLETAAELGLSLRFLGGLPLRANPAVAALLDLLGLVLPHSGAGPEPALPVRSVVEAWRSPYFDWSALEAEGGGPAGIGPAAADALDAAARWGRVIGGLSQWEEVLRRLEARAPAAEAVDEEQGVPSAVPQGARAAALRAAFERFLRRLAPPAAGQPVRAWVAWLEDLIGPDPEAPAARVPRPEVRTSLRVVARARAASGDLGERDVAALHALKDVLRGLVWAEEALGPGPGVPYARFVEELTGALEAAHYSLPLPRGREEIVAADLVQARGVAFRAVAVLGLAEAEFPAALAEDPFLRDADRARLREEHRLPLDPSTESAEVEYFYETLTRPRERLLLVRPRLAEDGSPWQASPFWEEVRRLVRAEPQALTTESRVPPAQAASWPELLESLAARPASDRLRGWAAGADPARLSALDAAALVLRTRHPRAPYSPFDGDLPGMAGTLQQRFGPDHVWSPSRLESYRTCPFLFFVASVLGLEPRPEPVEGLDARQAGTVYHRILEQVYASPRVRDPSDLGQLLAALPEVAERVLDAAPEQEGFRETAWWAQTRLQIVEHIRRSLEELASLSEGWVPVGQEAVFGLRGQPPLEVHAEQGAFRLHGVMDRVDCAPGGRVRVIDYKTSGPWKYTDRAAAEGKLLQVPLYALAARDALGLGEPAEGLYFHVRHAQASQFQMSRAAGGPQGAIDTAVHFAWEAVQGVRLGRFRPHPPADGCPPWCAAAAFCWHYAPRPGA